ncbi:MAG: hypothetical protein OET44_18715 [Gammaproteobacteria bacterium]|nr:hypothetical protein [Gammaproteobacteria bacterium]
MLKELAQKYEARRLNRDAVTVIETDTHTREDEQLVAIAAQTDANLKLARDALTIDTRENKTLERLKEIHRQARRHHDQIALSAATLAIIHFRARQLGDTAQPAQDVINRFLEQWRRAG